MQGSASDWGSSIEPYLRISHHCKPKPKASPRLTRLRFAGGCSQLAISGMDLPLAKLTDGAVPRQFHDLGAVDVKSLYTACDDPEDPQAKNLVEA